MSSFPPNAFSRAIYFDLELTCWNAPPPVGMKPEIIEVGIVELDLDQLVITDRLATFVRPKNWEISSRCTKLTGITEDDVRLAPDLGDVIELIANRFSPSAKLCGVWGIDGVIFDEACRARRLRSPFRNLFDVAQLFRNSFLLKDQPSLTTAITMLGINFVGTAHTALADAENTARVHGAIVHRARQFQLPAPADEVGKPDQTRSHFASKLARALDEAPVPNPDRIR